MSYASCKAELFSIFIMRNGNESLEVPCMEWRASAKSEADGRGPQHIHR